VPREGAAIDASDSEGMNGATRGDGSRAPDDQYRDLQQIAQKWRAMGTWVAGIIVAVGSIARDGSGAEYPDGKWHDPLNDAKDGRRTSANLRLLYVNRYQSERIADGATPYQV
jgi:hypothetical protein